MNNKLKKYIRQKRILVDSYLNKYLPPSRKGVIAKAMRYSVFAGGKRLRPILTLAAAKAICRDEKDVLPVACALEMIHTYSLIHDDLPAMDNDDLRRGKLTCHKKFGEDIAILAGDALMTYAYQVIAEKVNYKKIKPVDVLKVIKEIGRTTGVNGMVGGQVDDLKSEGKSISKEKLEKMHQKKTGSLITTAVKVGAMVRGENGSRLKKLTDYAKHFGLAFQIMDDILDITQGKKELGKTPKKDIKKKKSTYPSIYGLNKSKRIAIREVNEAKASLKGFGKEADELRWLAEYVIERKN